MSNSQMLLYALQIIAEIKIFHQTRSHEKLKSLLIRLWEKIFPNLLAFGKRAKFCERPISG